MTMRFLLLCCPALLAACGDDDPWADYTNRPMQVTALSATTGQSITQASAEIDGHQYQLIGGDIIELKPATDGATDRVNAGVAVVGNLDVTFTLRIDGGNDQAFSLQLDLEDPDSAPCDDAPCAKLIGTAAFANTIAGALTGDAGALSVTALSGNGGDSLAVLASPALAINGLTIEHIPVAD